MRRSPPSRSKERQSPLPPRSRTPNTRRDRKSPRRLPESAGNRAGEQSSHQPNHDLQAKDQAIPRPGEGALQKHVHEIRHGRCKQLSLFLRSLSWT